METSEDSVFDQAMARYHSGEDPTALIADFEDITSSMPNHSAGWTCLAWLQLLCQKYEDALRSARIAVKLNGQDPQARINLTLALLETKSKGVRDHIEFVKRILIVLPECERDLKESIQDGLKRQPDWAALKKVNAWLEF